MQRDICLLGLGEVGALLARELLGAGHSVRAWDIRFTQADSDAAKSAREISALTVADGPEQAVSGAELILSAVTAANDLVAAQSVARGLSPQCWFLDLNSVSPATKQAVSKVVEDAGGRYVEGAVLSPITPRGMQAPLLIGGPWAQGFAPVANALGFTNTSVASSEIGHAAATKMCRSVMIKGVEALLAEALLTARHYGVEDAVLSSLDNLLPHPDWPAHARYMISRTLEHGERRAEEMQEAADTVRGAGLEPLMSEACSARQAWGARFAGAAQAPELHAMLDAILAAQAASQRE